ncbi:MAG: hypothetical protein NWR72_19940 [Bacteroidia bacterium]|nr:hypothetical protein [Bacteroidia bacterium]
MKTSWLIVALLSFSTSVLAQNSQHALWLEGGGGNPSYAIQYEQFLTTLGRSSFEVYGRIGIGAERARVAVPLSVHAVSQGDPHHLVMMLGATPQIRNLNLSNTDTYLLLVGGLGYRYQTRQHPFMLSCMGHPVLITDPTPTQLIDRNPSLRFRLSVGAGISF